MHKRKLYAILVAIVLAGLVSLRASAWSDPPPPSNTSTTASFIRTIQGGKPLCWFDVGVGAHSDTAFTASAQSGGVCKGLRDQTSNGFDLKQATALNAPYYMTNQINGRPALVTNNSSNVNDEYMQGSQDVSARDLTVFAVISAPWAVITSSISWVYVPIGLQGAAGLGACPYLSASQDWGTHNQVVFGAGGTAGTRPRAFGSAASAIGADNTPHVFTWTAGTYSSCRIDGTVVSTTATAGSCAPSGVLSICVDSTTTLSSRVDIGSIAEIGLVDGVLPASEIKRIEAYLGQKYAISVYQQGSPFLAVLALGLALSFRRRRHGLSLASVSL